MNNNSQLQQRLASLPPALRNLVKEPSFSKINFDSLTSQNVIKAVHYRKTLTLTELATTFQYSEEGEIKESSPNILVFCQPSEEINIRNGDIYPYVPISYCTWLQAAGAKCIPLPYNLNQGSIQFLLERCQGLLIPGGCSNLYKNYELKQGYGPVTIGFLKVWRYIQKMWSRGIYFPVWGTCLGLEIALIAITNDVKILSNLNSKGHQLPIYSEYESSKFISQMPLKLKVNIENKKLINFMHSHGVTVTKFQANAKLREKLKIISISEDKDGKWFCSALEGKQNPIFLSQYHPEKQAFQWSKNKDIIHHKDSIEISQYLATQFVHHCRKCQNQKHFTDSKELLSNLILQFQQIYTPQKLYKVYAIDYRFKFHEKADKKIKSSQNLANHQPKQSNVKIQPSIQKNMINGDKNEGSNNRRNEDLGLNSLMRKMMEQKEKDSDKIK